MFVERLIYDHPFIIIRMLGNQNDAVRITLVMRIDLSRDGSV